MDKVSPVILLPDWPGKIKDNFSCFSINLAFLLLFADATNKGMDPIIPAAPIIVNAAAPS